jgi:hypothetical protein
MLLSVSSYIREHLPYSNSQVRFANEHPKLLWPVRRQPILGERGRYTREDRLRYLHPGFHHDIYSVGPSRRQICESHILPELGGTNQH